MTCKHCSKIVSEVRTRPVQTTRCKRNRDDPRKVIQNLLLTCENLLPDFEQLLLLMCVYLMLGYRQSLLLMCMILLRLFRTKFLFDESETFAIVLRRLLLICVKLSLFFICHKPEQIV